MKYTNILEKLMCLVNIISTNWTYLVFLGSACFLMFLCSIKKISRKVCFIIVLVCYLCLLGYVVFNNQKELGIVLNHLVENLFTNIYFPSTYVYLFILVVMDVGSFVSFLNFRESKVYKWIHGIFFFAIQFVFILILELISKDKIDVFSKTSLFSNKNLVILLEFSVNLFIVWLVAIIFVYFTNLITERIVLTKSRKVKPDLKGVVPANMDTLSVDISLGQSNEHNPESVVEKPQVSYVEPVLQNAVNIAPIVNSNPTTLESTVTNVSQDKVIAITPSQVIPTINQNVNVTEVANNSFNLSDLVPKKPEVVIPQPMTSDVIFEHILNNDLPVIQEEKNDETSHYTLNDYRLFNKILREIKEYNQNNTVTIDKNLEYRLITKYSTETYHMFKTMLKIYSN